MYFPVKGAHGPRRPSDLGLTSRDARITARRWRRRRAVHLLSCLLYILLTPAGVCLAADWALKPAPGETAMGEIQGGVVRTFEVRLAARRYLRLSLVKGDLNLSFSVYGPGGQKLVERISRRYETLQTPLLAEVEGVYTVEVRSLEEGDAGWRYELRIEEERGATPRDAKEIAAAAAAAEAGRLRAEWAEASLLKAVERYEEARELWRSAGSLRDAAAALAAAAEIYFTLGRYGQSLRLYSKAAEESRRAGDQLAELEAVNRIGLLTSHLGDNAAARRHLDRALDYHARRGGADESPQWKRARTMTLSYLGEMHYAKGELVKASQYFDQALELWVAVGDREGEATARLFKGYLVGTSGGRDEAVGQFEQARALSRALGNRSGEARALTGLGIIYSLKGEEQSALALHQEAGRIFHAIGDGQSEAVALSGVGQAYEDLNEKQTALDNYTQALKLAQVSGSLDLISLSFYKIARVYRSMGDVERALYYYGQCIALSRAGEKRRMEAYALNDTADIYAAQGRRRETLGQYQKILKLYREIGDRRGQALVLNSIGHLSSALGDERATRTSYGQALGPARESGDRELEVLTLYNVARAARSLGDFEGARAGLEQSVALIEELRTYVTSPELRASYFASVHKHYELYVDVLMQLEQRRPGEGFAAAALQASESARARALLERLAEAGADIREGVDESLLARERELQQQLTVLAQQQRERSSSGEGHAEADAVARDIRRLTAEYQLVQARMREQSPRYNSLTQPRPLRLEEMQAALGDDNTILLEYALGEERSYLWVLTRHSLEGHVLPARAVVEERAREVYNLLTARQEYDVEGDLEYAARVAEADARYRQSALELSRMLLGPAAGRLGQKRLLIVAEGVIQYIPFDALYAPPEGGAAGDPQPASDDEAMLLWRQEVVTLPSISTLVSLRSEKPRESLPDRVVAVVADPVFNDRDARLRGADEPGAEAESPDPNVVAARGALRGFRDSGNAADIPRLRHAAAEAAAITEAAPRGGWMLAEGFDACRETATSAAVGQYRVIHFATHSLVNSEHPERSGIILSMFDEHGVPRNGYLQLHDIYTLKLSADLVVLSACDTGLGKEMKGEGIIGLTRGFMFAGSKGVVASLWKVDDKATAELMRHFYRALLQEGLTPAASLRSAKQAVRRQKAFAAPYYWAGFQLQGEFTGSLRVGGKPVPAVVWVLAVVLASVGLYLLARRLGPPRPRWPR